MRYIHWRLLETGNRENGIAWFLEKTGLYVRPYGMYPRYFQNTRTFSILLGYLLTVSSSFMDTLETFLQGTAFLVIVGSFSTAAHTHIYYNQKSLGTFLRLIHKVEEMEREEWEEEMFQEEMNVAWKCVNTYWNIIIYYNYIYVLLPATLDTFLGLVCPYCPSLRVILPLEGFIRATGQRTLGNFAITLVSLIYSTCNMVSNGGVQSFLFYSIVFTRTQIKLVCRKLEILKERLEGDRPYPAKALPQINDLYGFPIACLSVLVAGGFCVNLYAVTVFKSDDFSVIEDFAAALLLLGLVYSLYVMGESLETENYELYKKIYDVPWYKEDVKFRKSIIMMLRQSANEYYISYKGGFRLNVDAYLQIMNTSYTYYMMMRRLVG